MAGNDDEMGAAIGQLAAELAECRQRGIERLDRHGHKQSPVAADVLQRLAREYTESRGIQAHGRTAQIKVLLRHALDALAVAGGEADANLIRDLFFGDSAGIVLMSAGELLESAQRRLGEPSEARFRERRQTAFRAFAAFLIQFAADARGRADDARGRAAGAEAVPGAEPGGGAGAAVAATASRLAGVTRREVATAYVDDGERFVELLAEAINVTIVGYTNQRLAGRLEEALRRKREALGRPDAFWSSLRIVYLSMGLLDFLNDERSEFPDPKEAARLRRLAATYGYRSLLAFLRRTPSFRWALYEAQHVPPLIGTIFEMPAGTRIVQLLVPRPQRSAPDHRFIEMEDLPDQYFASAFEDIVHNSVSDNKIVPIGLPADGVFRCTGMRYRQRVLVDGSGETGWLPVVLVITYQRRGDRVDVLLQRRTANNAARELGRISHLAAHIYYQEMIEAGPPGGAAQLILGIDDEVTVQAARRRVQMETGEDLPLALLPVGTGRYLHHDKEHMFFFAYALELPEDFQFPRQAEMSSFSLGALLDVRENHALRNALLLCRSAGMSARAWSVGSEIAALNLVLHGHGDLADRVRTSGGPSGARCAAVAAELEELERRTRQQWISGGQEAEILGLSGWQFRELYGILLPAYAALGITGAGQQLALLRADTGRSRALARLAELYHDETLMTGLPLEL